MSVLINNEKLWDLLQHDENDKVDFKSSELLTNPDGENRYKIAKHLAGFANHRGGKIIFGVDDDREPEGVNLIESECLSTISEIANARCSPTVDFSHNFYSNQSNDLSAGCVLVLNVLQRANSPPIAVTERSDGNIRKREYRIRSGDSTRLVTDGELVSLFHENPDLELETSSLVKYFHTHDYEPLSVSPTPIYFLRMNDLYDYLSNFSEEIAKVLDDPESGYTMYHALFRRALIISILHRLNIRSHDQMQKSINEKVSDIDINKGYEFESYDLSTLKIKDEVLLDEIGFDFEECLSELNEDLYFTDQDKTGLFIPKGGEVEVSEDISEINIYLENEFEIVLKINWHSSQTGLPEEHPESKSNTGNPHERVDGSKRTITGSIQMSTEFAYPEQDYNGYMTSKFYSEEIANIVVDRYDWEQFEESLPNRKLFQIENKLDELRYLIDDRVE